ncbi:Ankyrin-2 [Trichoplax sp. H2]|nr:Ankyrin-2 [Trichoplax sp. H2]|eukprot:RDD45189.1 Ankyrin-2 [Trichoplax sp. H2]
MEGELLSPLLLASKNGDVQQVKQLLSTDRDLIEQRDKDGRTALHWAAHSGNVETILVLYNCDCKLNLTTKTGIQPLHDACLAGNVKAVQLLIALGVDLQAKIKHGWTPLLCAAGNGYLDIVHLLISSGVDDDLQSTKCGVNALHIAAWTGQDDIVELLLKLGYDTSIKSQSGKSALEMAEEENHEDCIELLRKHPTEKHDGDHSELRAEIKRLKTKLKRCKEKLKLTQSNMEATITKEREKYENELLDMKKKHRNKINDLKSQILQLQHQISLQQSLYDSPALKRSSWTGTEANISNQAEIPLTVASTPASPTGTSLRRHLSTPHADRMKFFSREREMQNSYESSNDESAIHDMSNIRQMANSKQRPSLTQLHMESLLNPDSMAYLRKVTLRNGNKNGSTSPMGYKVDKSPKLESILNANSPSLPTKPTQNKILPHISHEENSSRDDDF